MEEGEYEMEEQGDQDEYAFERDDDYYEEENYLEAGREEV